MLETTEGIIIVSLVIFLIIISFIIILMAKRDVDNFCDKILGKRR